MILLLISIIISSCIYDVKHNIKPTIQVETNTPQTNSTVQVKPTFINQVESTITQKLEQTISPSVEKDIPFCNAVETDGSMIKATEIHGTIIYQDKYFSELNSFSGLSLITSTWNNDGYDQILFLGISPDDQWMAYTLFNTNQNDLFEDVKILLLSSNGEKIEHNISIKEFESELQVGHQFIGIASTSYWITNDLIYITLYSQNPDTNTSGLITEYVKILNPFTGEWEPEYLELPGKNTSQMVSVSPDLSRALYQTYDLSLWDYSRNSTIWHNDHIYGFPSVKIIWNADSSIAAFASIHDISQDQRVVLITRDGKSNPIVTQSYPIQESYVFNISWSKDGKKLAIAMKEENNLIILLYDVEISKFIVQCPLELSDLQWVNLTWSPNNSMLAISQGDIPIKIYDVENQMMKDLPINGFVVGWSDQFSSSIP